MSKPVQDSESRHADKYIVRFPDGMRDRLKAAAAAENRSLNAEIIARLEKSLQSPSFGLESLERYNMLLPDGKEWVRLQIESLLLEAAHRFSTVSDYQEAPTDSAALKAHKR